MPLDQAVKDALGDKFTEAQLIDQLMPDVQTKLGETHIIRTKEDDDSLVSSRVTQEVDAKISAKISEAHQKYDDDIFEITGLRKKVNEKTYEFNKRVLADLKAKAAGAGGDQALKDQITSLTETLTQKDNDHATELTKIQQGAFEKQLKLIVKAEFDGRNIDIPAKITTDEAKQKYINDQKRLLEQDFLSKYTPKEDSEGNIVYYLGEKIQQNTTNGKPLTASELISADYGSYFSAPGNKQTGAGSGKEGIPAEGFSSTEQVYEYLEKSKNMEPGSLAFTNEARKLIKEHGIII